MNVTLVCFGRLKDHLPPGGSRNRISVEVPEGADVATAAGAIGARQRDLFAVLVNGERCDARKVLREGDEVTLMPPFSGG
ncbi:MAG: MoaD/ThiS family protein [Actinomycetota bacterium]